MRANRSISLIYKWQNENNPDFLEQLIELLIAWYESQENNSPQNLVADDAPTPAKVNDTRKSFVSAALNKYDLTPEHLQFLIEFCNAITAIITKLNLDGYPHDCSDGLNSILAECKKSIARDEEIINLIININRKAVFDFFLEMRTQLQQRLRLSIVQPARSAPSEDAEAKRAENLVNQQQLQSNYLTAVSRCVVKQWRKENTFAKRARNKIQNTPKAWHAVAALFAALFVVLHFFLPHLLILTLAIHLSTKGILLSQILEYVALGITMIGHLVNMALRSDAASAVKAEAAPPPPPATPVKHKGNAQGQDAAAAPGVSRAPTPARTPGPAEPREAVGGVLGGAEKEAEQINYHALTGSPGPAWATVTTAGDSPAPPTPRSAVRQIADAPEAVSALVPTTNPVAAPAPTRPPLRRKLSDDFDKAAADDAQRQQTLQASVTTAPDIVIFPPELPVVSSGLTPAASAAGITFSASVE